MVKCELTPEQLRALASTIPSGGTMNISEDSNRPGHFVFYGDRNGIIQLGISLLRYAVEAKMIGTGRKAESVTEKTLFDKASQVQWVSFQLDEGAREAAEGIQRKRRSAGLFRRLFP